MEYCELGNLQHAIQRSLLNIQDAAEVLKQAFEGLVYLHANGIAHRDLKSQNILVRSANPLSIALADFGIAKVNQTFMSTRCGTVSHMAPEIEGGGYLYDNAVDVWALGIVGLELLLGDLVGNPREPFPRWMFDQAEALYVANPKNRLVANIRKMLAWSPEDRPDAAECLEDAEELEAEGLVAERLDLGGLGVQWAAVKRLRGIKQPIPLPVLTPAVAAPTPSTVEVLDSDGAHTSSYQGPGERTMEYISRGYHAMMNPIVVGTKAVELTTVEPPAVESQHHP